MKKIKIFMTLVLSLVSIINPNSKIKVSAENSPFALITTEYDSEPNNYFTNDNYLFGNGQNDHLNYGNKSGNVTGIIQNSTDIDYYRFNVFSDCTVSFRLSMLDTSHELTHDYDFTLYKQDNEINPTQTNVTELATTNLLGAVDSYSASIVPGTYYIKIFGRNGAYSARNSYKLYYTLTKESKHTIDINTYKLEHPNSYLVWASDFNFLETKKLNNVAGKYVGINRNLDTLSHDVMDYFYSLNGFPNLEIYLWGRELRIDFYDAVQTILTQLYIQRDQLNRANEEILFQCQILDNLQATFKAINIVSTELFSVKINFNSLLNAMLFFGIINTREVSDTIPICDLITSFSVISSALAVDNETTDTQIVALTQMSKIQRNYSDKKFYLTNVFTAFGTDVSNSSRFIGSNLTDVLGYTHYITGVHTNIYGDIYYPNEMEGLFY